jgi:hypothetical protein
MSATETTTRTAQCARVSILLRRQLGSQQVLGDFVFQAHGLARGDGAGERVRTGFDHVLVTHHVKTRQIVTVLGDLATLVALVVQSLSLSPPTTHPNREDRQNTPTHHNAHSLAKINGSVDTRAEVYRKTWTPCVSLLWIGCKIKGQHSDTLRGKKKRVGRPQTLPSAIRDAGTKEDRGKCKGKQITVP